MCPHHMGEGIHFSGKGTIKQRSSDIADSNFIKVHAVVLEMLKVYSWME
jgi:hypothetical protein